MVGKARTDTPAQLRARNIVLAEHDLWRHVARLGTGPQVPTAGLRSDRRVLPFGSAVFGAELEPRPVPDPGASGLVVDLAQ